MGRRNCCSCRYLCTFSIIRRAHTAHQRGKPAVWAFGRADGISERYVEARTNAHAVGSPAGRFASCNIRARSLRHRNACRRSTVIPPLADPSNLEMSREHAIDSPDRRGTKAPHSGDTPSVTQTPSSPLKNSRGPRAVPFRPAREFDSRRISADMPSNRPHEQDETARALGRAGVLQRAASDRPHHYH